MHGEVFDEKATVLKNFEDAGFDTDAQVIGYLKTYGFEEELIYSPVGNLSGGEKISSSLRRFPEQMPTFSFWTSQPAIWTPIPSLPLRMP